MRPQASIVIPTYNRRDLLCLTLESLSRQGGDKSSFEVIVVDDGSTDGSGQAVNAFHNRLNLSCVRQEHCGFRVARARNLGLERSCGEVLVFVDSGMVLSKDFVSSHLAAHAEGTPAAVLGYVHGYDFNVRSPALAEMRVLVESDADSAIAALAQIPVGLDIREQVYRVVHDRVETLPAPWTLFWTTNVSVPRQALLDLGGFDEDFVQWGMEDLELGFRLWRKGLRFVLSRRAAGIHYPHERDNAANLRSHGENRFLFHHKHRALESEALLASDPLRLNFELAQYRAYQQARASLWQQRMPASSTYRHELACMGELVFGFRNGDLLSMCGSKAGIDADPAWVACAREQRRDVDARLHLGIRTSFADGSFDSCLLAGAIMAVPKPWLAAISAEAARVARRSYVLSFEGVPCDLALKGASFSLGAGICVRALCG